MPQVTSGRTRPRDCQDIDAASIAEPVGSKWAFSTTLCCMLWFMIATCDACATLESFPWTDYSSRHISPPYQNLSRLEFTLQPSHYSMWTGWNPNLYLIGSGDYTCETGTSCSCGMDCDASLATDGRSNCVETDIFETSNSGFYFSVQHPRRAERNTFDGTWGQRRVLWSNTDGGCLRGVVPPLIRGQYGPGDNEYHYLNFTRTRSHAISGNVTFHPNDENGTLIVRMEVQNQPSAIIFEDNLAAKQNFVWNTGWGTCYRGQSNPTNKGNGYMAWRCGLSVASSNWYLGPIEGATWVINEGSELCIPWPAYNPLVPMIPLVNATPYYS